MDKYPFPGVFCVNKIRKNVFVKQFNEQSECLKVVQAQLHYLL